MEGIPEAIPHLKWAYSSLEKFFAGGIWEKLKLWPWITASHTSPATMLETDFQMRL
jgi:hypothetical protein